MAQPRKHRAGHHGVDPLIPLSAYHNKWEMIEFIFGKDMK